MKIKNLKTYTITTLIALVFCAFSETAASQERINIGRKLNFSIDETARYGSFSIPGTSMKAPENAVFWRLILDDGQRTEIAVFSNAQSGKASIKDSMMLIRYDSITALDGTVYNVALDIEIREEKDGVLSFHPVVENGDKRVRVNELQCPIFETTELCGPHKDDVLYMPNATGRRLVNPWDGLKAYTTYYLANDEKEITWAAPYPRGSMAWMGIETGGNFLYIGRHDDKIRNCIFIARRNALHLPEKIALTVAHMPAARTGEKLEIAPVTIALLPGDWRSGAAKYRAWAETSFFKPVKKDKWVQEMNGWQRIILRSQYGEDYYTFDDLPRLYEIGRKYGIDALFLFGWWTEGMDVGYPEYNMTPEAKKKLKENIEKVQEAGGHVILVCNANMIDPLTDYYKQHGADVIRKDMYGNPYISAFGYSEYSAMRRLFASRPFHQICYSAPEWREQLVRQGELMKEFSPHSIFYDIFGGAPHQPCFDDKHDHGPRIDEDWVIRRKVFDRLAELCAPSTFGTEITVDIASAYVQYIHANDGFVAGETASERFFPQMFRQTFPEVIISNRGVRDESSGFDRSLKFAFMMGMIYDVEVFRCRGNMDDVPAYAKLVAELNQKRQQYKDFLIYGKFSLSDRNFLPKDLYCTEYESANGKQRLRILFNDTEKPVKYMDVTLEPSEMRFDIFDL